MHSIQVRPLYLAIVGVLAVTTFLLAAESNPPGQAIWPPPRARVLNVFEESDAPGVAIPGGAYVDVLTVPTDSWLTITGASALPASTGGLVTLRWVEVDVNSVITKKGRVSFGAMGIDTSLLGSPESTPLGGGGPIGWTFAPGSKVALLNQGTTTVGVTMRSLLGYYSRL